MIYWISVDGGERLHTTYFPCNQYNPYIREDGLGDSFGTHVNRKNAFNLFMLFMLLSLNKWIFILINGYCNSLMSTTSLNLCSHYVFRGYKVKYFSYERSILQSYLSYYRSRYSRKCVAQWFRLLCENWPFGKFEQINTGSNMLCITIVRW